MLRFWNRNRSKPPAPCVRCGQLEQEVAHWRQRCDEERSAKEREQAEKEKWQQRSQELQQQLDELSRSVQRQAAPFRRRRRKPPEQHRKPGRKPGHPRAAPLPPETVDRTLEARLPVCDCPDCRIPLEVTTQVQYQIDIPPVKPIVTQFNVEVGVCPDCGKRIQGTHEEQTSQALGAAHHAIGPRALALAVDCKYRLGVPLRKVSQLLSRHFGLSFSAGGIARAATRLAKRSQGVYEVLKWQLAGKYVTHADETGWRIGGQGAWLHCFASDNLVIFTVRSTRSGAVAREVLGADYGGTVSCDGYAAYDVFRTARCNAHVLRRAEDLADHRQDDARQPLDELCQLLRQGLALRDRREELTKPGYRGQVTRLLGTIEHWIETHAQSPDKEIGRLARHLQRYQTEFFRYLEDPRLPATNNYGEQTIRFAVVLRKRGCCNKTARGAATFEVLSSLLATFEKRGKDFSKWVEELLSHGHPKIIPPDLLPPDCQLLISL